jgi:hypothetical protein
MWFQFHVEPKFRFWVRTRYVPFTHFRPPMHLLPFVLRLSRTHRNISLYFYSTREFHLPCYLLSFSRDSLSHPSLTTLLHANYSQSPLPTFYPCFLSYSHTRRLVSHLEFTCSVPIRSYPFTDLRNPSGAKIIFNFRNGTLSMCLSCLHARQ